MKVLLTGFEPFGRESINPSWEVAQRVSAEEFDGIAVVPRRLPSVFGEAIEEAVPTIIEVEPDVVISVGQAGGSSAIGLERVTLDMEFCAT
mgnify:CR=1 FL=1